MKSSAITIGQRSPSLLPRFHLFLKVVAMKKHKTFRRVFFCEQLESRCLLSSLLGSDEGEFHAVIVAGDPKGTPKDSPALRVDPNTTDSPFAGVGSLRIAASSGTYICTATPIDATHVLTAGHCVDIDNNGLPDVSGITFNLNYGGDLTSQIPAVAWETHPDYTGFNSPSVNDDLAVITLSESLPALVPTYSLANSDMVAGTTHLYLVGYGRSGDGVRGYSTGASFIVKRDGENMVDAFYGQDDGGTTPVNEVFRFDFDGPKASTNKMGGRTLGNDKETTLGGGDSGGPSFVLVDGVYYLAGVNTFTQGFNAPKFGSLGGGINVFPYTGWIRSIIDPTSASGSSGGGVTATGSASVLGSAILGILASEENVALLTAPGNLLASHAEDRLSSTIWMNPSQCVGIGLAPAAPPIAATAADADAVAGEFAKPALRTRALVAKAENKSTPDDALETKDWDSKALDAIFQEWTNR
jgi:Trypsin